jgi:serine/threonine protein kinase
LADRIDINTFNFKGTPSYLSPESILKLNSDPIKKDVWSLGVIIYALKYLRFPF